MRDLTRLDRLARVLVALAAAAGAVQAAGAPANAASASASRYVVMKQVKIIDQGLGHGRPAYDLLIPTSWQFKGAVNVGVAEGGCFADWFGVMAEAKSADNSIDLQILPQYTWVFVSDPQGQRVLTQQMQKDVQFKIKPCTLRAPVHVADFLRTDLLARYRKGKTIVSVEPDPELDRIARHRLGLPPDGTGNPGGVHTEAARARLSYDDESGHPVEEWLTAVIVVRALPSSRGVAYDWHAINVMSLRTPRGQLDANDKLFRLIAASLRPEPQWQAWSNGVIAGLYQKKGDELAKQSVMIGEFQHHVADVVNGVTANRERGSQTASFGAGQLTRSVQTFVDPASGKTIELSNQYDHAWHNGSNQYVMSDDPGFNPNGQINGDWTSLQQVRPQP